MNTCVLLVVCVSFCVLAYTMRRRNARFYQNSPQPNEHVAEMAHVYYSDDKLEMWP